MIGSSTADEEARDDSAALVALAEHADVVVGLHVDLVYPVEQQQQSLIRRLFVLDRLGYETENDRQVAARR